MFGIVGKLLGGVAGGFLDKVGLGKITPFVKMGLNAVTGNWLGVAKDVFGLVSNFKGNFLDRASKNPPLGNFGNFGNNFAPQQNNLTGNRLSDLFRSLGDLFKSFSGGNQNGNPFQGIGKIFDAFRAISDFFGNNQLFSNRQSSFQFNQLNVR